MGEKRRGRAISDPASNFFNYGGCPLNESSSLRQSAKIRESFEVKRVSRRFPQGNSDHYNIVMIMASLFLVVAQFESGIFQSRFQIRNPRSPTATKTSGRISQTANAFSPVNHRTRTRGTMTKSNQ
jgi:hypothetical protein